LARIGDKPMIQWVYECAAAVPEIDRVLVATDDERICDAVASFGGEAVMTRPTHPSGTDRVAEVAASLDAALVVNVQGDLPFFDPGLVGAPLAALDREDIPMATVRTRIATAEDQRDPNVVKVVTDQQQLALYFSRSPIPYRAEDADRGDFGYRHIGLYVYRRDFLLTFARLEPTPLERIERLEQLRALERGYRIKVCEVGRDFVEVNTPADLERARAMAGGQ